MNTDRAARRVPGHLIMTRHVDSMTAIHTCRCHGVGGGKISPGTCRIGLQGTDQQHAKRHDPQHEVWPATHEKGRSREDQYPRLRKMVVRRR